MFCICYDIKLWADIFMVSYQDAMDGGRGSSSVKTADEGLGCLLL
jgi:hypothetical protein